MNSQTVISVEKLSKSYQLGQISTGTLARDLSVWWARLRGKPNPLLKIGPNGYRKLYANISRYHADALLKEAN